jgi:hypothetical protein
MKFNNTYKEFTKISKLIIKDLRNQLKEQKHIASGKLSRSFTGVQEKISGDNIILNITSSKDYWRVVNDKKGLDRNFANAIYKRLARGIYGKEKEKYVYWKEGNNIQRTNFAGICCKRKFTKNRRRTCTIYRR